MLSELAPAQCCGDIFTGLLETTFAHIRELSKGVCVFRQIYASQCLNIHVRAFVIEIGMPGSRNIDLEYACYEGRRKISVD